LFNKEEITMGKHATPKEKRKQDPYLDRRSGEDRRKVYDLDHFSDGGIERRDQKERRDAGERRKDCIKVSNWSSVCPKVETSENSQ
jgi:hypothetical protein